MDPTDRFADVVAADSIPLDLAAVLIGAVGDPACDVPATIGALDDLAATVREASLNGLLAALFGPDGFQGARRSYYHPRNSFMHEVLARRTGIPITLSIVTMEVGRRVGVHLAGVGTPAHFMVRTVAEAEVTFVDPFSFGATHDRASLDAMFASIAPGVDLDPYLQPLGTADILRRMLTNLVVNYRRLGDRDGLLWSSALRTMLPDCDISHLREYSAALAASGDYARAAKVRESLATLPGGDAARERAEADQLRARLN